jgi:phage terminase large subunit
MKLRAENIDVPIRIPPKLIPVFEGEAPYRGAYGGRGSGKTRTFAKMAAVRGILYAQNNMPGLIVCAREFMNSLADSSFAEVKAAIESEPYLLAFYDIGENYIRTKARADLPGRIDFTFVGLRYNLDSIKSKSRIRLLWVDEAEPVTETAWVKAIPTVREHGSEIWLTWNPEREESATHKRFRKDPPTGAKIVEVNWNDNPWFNRTRLAAERLDDMAKRPEQYDHIWEGGYKTVIEGAYFAPYLLKAKQEGRIGFLAADPCLSLRIFCDIGGTGKRSDAFAMWIAQFIDREVRVLDYYEKQGQSAAFHLAWLRERGYTPGRAGIWLPHDGEQQDRIYDASYEGVFKAAGYEVVVIPNQGAGAAMARVEAARRLFPSIRFHEQNTEGGRKALGWYHEKIDEQRKIGLGPDHDWSSHGADAFGLMCVAYEEPQIKRKRKTNAPSSWMG